MTGIQNSMYTKMITMWNYGWMGKIICKNEKSFAFMTYCFLKWTFKKIGDIEKYWKSGVKEYPVKKNHNSKVLAIGNTHT